MKKLVLFLSLILNGLAFADYHQELNPVIDSVDNCLKTEGVLLCDSKVPSLLRELNLNIRGEFVLFISSKINQNENEKVIVNAYEKLSALVPMYEELDTCSEWSCRDLKNLVDQISIKYAKAAKINADFLKGLYKNQAGEGGRYGLLLTMKEKGNQNISADEIENLIRFAEYAKDLSKSLQDPSYVYYAAVSIVRDMTHKALQVRKNVEGVYSLNFEDAAKANELGVDKLVIMQSNLGDGVVVNFVTSKSRAIKVSFTGAGLLGDTFFSNDDVYNNDQSAANQYFKFDLDRSSMTVKGYLYTARYGRLYFKASLAQSHANVYSENNVKGLSMNNLEGKYTVLVGKYPMTLVISKRAEERTNYEAALYNDNAMISFSRVNLDSEKGVISMVDWNNTRELILAVTNFTDKAELKGQFLNSPLALVLDVTTK